MCQRLRRGPNPQEISSSASANIVVITARCFVASAGSGALLHGVVELALALLLQQIVESLGFHVRLLFQDGLVGLQHAIHGREGYCLSVSDFVRILDLERSSGWRILPHDPVRVNLLHPVRLAYQIGAQHYG